MSLPATCVIDTNVPKVANCATRPNPGSDFPDSCVKACVDAIEHVMCTGSLILDAGDEIYNEYTRQLSRSGQPGIGDIFMKWVHDYRMSFDESQRVRIKKCGDSYDEFPSHRGLDSFHKKDRKFVAVSNAHPEKPPILQAIDSKWWGWNDALSECGIEVNFLCPDYVKNKYVNKMER